MEGQSSTALSPEGKSQAKQLAQMLVSCCSAGRCPSTFTIDKPTYLYSSPLLRAQQTAQCLSAALQQSGHSFQTVEDSRLKEIHQGIFQGLTWPEAQTSFPQLCARLMSTPAWQPVPGAESPQEARARSHNWLTQILSRHQPGETLWAVSHAGFMMHLIAEIRGQRSPWEKQISHTATFEFWFSTESLDVPQPDDLGSKRWRLHYFNQLY